MVDYDESSSLLGSIDSRETSFVCLSQIIQRDTSSIRQRGTGLLIPWIKDPVDDRERSSNYSSQESNNNTVTTKASKARQGMHLLCKFFAKSQPSKSKELQIHILAAFGAQQQWTILMSSERRHE
jgi:hypothetical protein